MSSQKSQDITTRAQLEEAIEELRIAGCCQHGSFAHCDCGDRCTCVEALDRQLREILHLEGQRERDMIVQEVRRETADTSTLVLFSGDPLLDYEAGQFLTIDPHQFPQLARFTSYLEAQKGKREKPRAYSLSSAPHEHSVTITIKAEPFVADATPYPPLLSPYLVGGLAPGSSLKIRGFTGAYVLRATEAKELDLVLHLCAGSGIVPSLSIIKESLHRGDTVRHLLLYSSRTREHAAFYEEFER